MFKKLADSYRLKQVQIPQRTLPPPPIERNAETSWQWMLGWMNWRG
jgi:hypothetical protein